VENDPGLAAAIERRDELRRLNPHLNVLVSLFYREGKYIANEEDHSWWELGHYPPDSPFWIRDEAGMPVPGFGEDADGDGVIEADEVLTALVDFRMPELIELVAQRALAVQRNGVADGIMLDWWNEHSLTAASSLDWSTFYMTAEEELESRLVLIRRIRELVGDDFLILVNTNDRTAPLSAPYANGTFMELFKPDWSAGYTREAIIGIEETLAWATEAFREPRINCLEGWRVVTDYGNAAAQIDERDTEENRQWMRLFTTMALTHSDETVVFGDDNAEPTVDHLHNWYDFWDADLGQPVGPKRTIHEGVDGLFIREFTNGYAVYNRSGADHEIHLPDPHMSVSSEQVGSTHLVADMDGEIFLWSGLEVAFEGATPGQLVWQTGWMVNAGLLGPECAGHGPGGYSTCGREIRYSEASGADLGLMFSLSSKPTTPVVLDITWDPTEVNVGPAAGGCTDVSQAETLETLRVTVEPDDWTTAWDGPEVVIATSGAGDGIADGDQVTEVRVTVVDELSDPMYHDADDLVLTVTTVDRPDGATCH